MILPWNDKEHDIFHCLNDADLLALVAYMEDRGDGEHGMRAVLQVCSNRLDSVHYGNTWKEVCLGRLQFSFLNPHDPEFPLAVKLAMKLLCKGADVDEMTLARQLGREALTNCHMCPEVGKATLYHNLAVHPELNGQWHADRVRFIATIGHQKYFQEIRV